MSTQLKSLVFYKSGSLGDMGAEFYYDYDLPLFWDMNKGLILDLTEMNDAYLTLLDYHDKGFMKFKEPWRIEEFIDLYDNKEYPIFDEFTNNWGSWDFSTVMNFASARSVCNPYYVKLLEFYPEFLLDMVESLEEKVGIELQDGMGILPYDSYSDFYTGVSVLPYLFISKEKYLIGKEILFSKECELSVANNALEYFKEHTAEVFDLSTLEYIYSEVKFNESKFKKELDKIDKKIEKALKGIEVTPQFNLYLYQVLDCFRHNYFKVDLLDGSVEDYSLANWLESIKEDLLLRLYTYYYGSTSHAESSITTDHMIIDLKVVKRDGVHLTLKISTTVCFG